MGQKFTIFALFYFVFEGKFQVQAPRGVLYLEGRFNGGFFALRFWGALFGRDLYMEGLIFGILRYLIINCVPQLVWGFSQAIWLQHINKVIYLSACLSVYLSKES